MGSAAGLARRLGRVWRWLPAWKGRRDRRPDVVGPAVGSAVGSMVLRLDIQAGSAVGSRAIKPARAGLGSIFSSSPDHIRCVWFRLSYGSDAETRVSTGGKHKNITHNPQNPHPPLHVDGLRTAEPRPQRASPSCAPTSLPDARPVSSRRAGARNAPRLAIPSPFMASSA